jgi:hypothetical protein
MSRSASQNDSNNAVGSYRRATGAGAASKQRGGSRGWRCRRLVSSLAGRARGASARKGSSIFQRIVSREPGRASLVGSGAVAVNASSTANKSLKFVPALRASTGRAKARRLAKRWAS